jgi:uncharacterized protein YqjF (DUF2071 family)
MAKIFLTAEWRNLLMANYEVDPAILKRYLPCYTELDSYHGKYYVSLVGFLFKNTKIKGMEERCGVYKRDCAAQHDNFCSKHFV